MPRLTATLAAMVLLSGCVTPQAPNTYSRQQMGREGTVERGEILTLREVEISGSNTGLGAGAGAAAGATAGSYVGGDFRTNIIGAIGGAVVGGLAGAVVEEGATQAKATEFLIRKDNGDTVVIVQSNADALAVGDRIMIIRMDRVRIVRDIGAKEAKQQQ